MSGSGSISIFSIHRRDIRALARKKKNDLFCMNWEIKRNWGSGSNVSNSVGSVGDQGAKPLEFEIHNM